MKEELRFAYSNADILYIKVTVLARVGILVDVFVMLDDLMMLMNTTGVQSVVRDTLGIAVMPKWCAGSLDYLRTVSFNILDEQVINRWELMNCF